MQDSKFSRTIRLCKMISEKSWNVNWTESSDKEN